MPFHNKLKNLIDKAKEKQEEYAFSRKVKEAKAKGFSNYHVYETQTAIARKEGYDEAQSKLRKDELRKVKEEEYQNTITPKPKYSAKVQKGIGYVQKGAGVYNDIMKEFKGLSGNQGSFNMSQNTNQAYSSGYGPYEPKKQTSSNFMDMYGVKMQKTKRTKKNKMKKQKHRKKQTKPKDIYEWIKQR